MKPQNEIAARAVKLSGRAFMKLPLEEQRRIMAKQAERVDTYYESDPEWRQFQGGDFIEY